jgi:Mg-chelatase subunit ChlD
MNSISFRVAAAVLTFVIGISVATVWAFTRTQPTIKPVDVRNETPTLEMVFVVDTTGSMGGLIEGAKQRIWGIVNEVMQQQSHPAVKIGLVAYRDRGDQYVTQVLPLTEDLDKVYMTLMQYQAEGGGDEPEDVRRALLDGLQKAGWSRTAPRIAQVLFLVGDAPPHTDYKGEQDTLETAAQAVDLGIVVNTIQCGSSAQTKEVWESIARRGEGQYFAIPQTGGVQAISTPYDEDLSKLGTKLGGTYLAYGGGAGIEGEHFRGEAKRIADTSEATVAASAPMEARALRSINKLVNANAYIGDLLQNIENGSVKLESVKEADLPDELKKLSPEERKQEVDKRLAERKEIRNQILSLSKLRADYVAAQQKKQGISSHNSFDVAVSAALKEQLAKKGIK